MEEKTALIIQPLSVLGENQFAYNEFALPVPRSLSIPVDKLKKELHEFALTMADLATSLNISKGEYELDDIEVIIQITGDGRIGILGTGIGGELMGGIKLKYTKTRANEGVIASS